MKMFYNLLITVNASQLKYSLLTNVFSCMFDNNIKIPILLSKLIIATVVLCTVANLIKFYNYLQYLLIEKVKVNLLK